jgi:hypothetical protein
MLVPKAVSVSSGYPQLGDDTAKNGLDNYPIVFYTARHWKDHALVGEVSSWIRVEQLFDSDGQSPIFPAWIEPG